MLQSMCPSGGSGAGDGAGVGAAARLPAVSGDVAAVGFCKDSLEETAEVSHPSSCRRFLLLATTEGLINIQCILESSLTTTTGTSCC
jgi:hypothetical protein